MVTLDHINLITKRLDETVRFYEVAFGLERGFYPPELSRGAWLYDSTGRPVIHMQEVAEAGYPAFAANVRPRRGALGPLPDFPALHGSGTVDHVALSSDDFAGICSRLDALGLDYHSRTIPSARLDQIFVGDPNGVLIEVNCRWPAERT